MLLEEQVVETIVEKVEWNVSKYRKLYPRVKVEEGKYRRSKYYVRSGKSAQFIWKNKIGVGAVVQIARSCDVIPDIVKVIKKAKQADMPETEYEWNETEVDIFSVDDEDDDVCKMKLVGDFFKKYKCRKYGSGNSEEII